MRALDPRLIRRARAVRLLLGLDIVLGVASTVLVLVQATVFAWVVARAFDGAGLGDVLPGILILALAFAGRGVLAWAFEVAGRRAATTALSDLRLSLVEQRLRTAPAALDGVEAAEVAAASVAGIDPLAAYFGRYLPQVVLACITPVAILGWVGMVDATSALVMLATLPLVPVFMWLIGRFAEERARERWRALRLLSAHYLDVMRGLPTLRSFNRGRAQVTTIADVGEQYRKATMGTLRISFLSGSVLELAATLGVALVAVTVGVRLVGGSLTLQAGLVVLVLAPELYAPLRQLGVQFHTSADGLAVAERILALLDDQPGAASPRIRVAPSPATASIELREVSFSYPSRAGKVLDDFELALHPGEAVALIGESGSGKTTVASLILGLAQPTAGRVEIGGVDLAGCRLDEWRRGVSWVPQAPTMFRGTVAENIRIGDPEASDERVRSAASIAGADVFVRRLPEGYQTVIGDGGRPLSAGERRRIALARALVRDAPLVVLDEPTADLDPASAAHVARALAALHGRRTVLLIAHRPELTSFADRVVALAGGRSAESFDEAAA